MNNLNANLNVGYCSSERSQLTVSKTKKIPPQIPKPQQQPPRGFHSLSPGSPWWLEWWMVLVAGSAGVRAGTIGPPCGAQSRGGSGKPWSNAGSGYFMACT